MGNGQDMKLLNVKMLLSFSCSLKTGSFSQKIFGSTVMFRLHFNWFFTGLAKNSYVTLVNSLYVLDMGAFPLLWYYGKKGM